MIVPNAAAAVQDAASGTPHTRRWRAVVRPARARRLAPSVYCPVGGGGGKGDPPGCGGGGAACCDAGIGRGLAARATGRRGRGLRMGRGGGGTGCSMVTTGFGVRVGGGALSQNEWSGGGPTLI